MACSISSSPPRTGPIVESCARAWHRLGERIQVCPRCGCTRDRAPRRLLDDGWELRYALDIDDSGAVVGIGREWDDRGFLLLP